MNTLPSQTAAVLYGAKDIRMQTRALWPPQPGQCSVRIEATGLCGSDLHYFVHGRNGDFAVRAPLVLGHEAAGVVTQVGPGVTNLVVGQRVAIEAGIQCGDCNFCKKGRYNLCKAMRFCSSAKTFPHLDGTLQETINHPASVLFPIPDSVSFEQAALAEPLSVILHASRRAQLSAGQSVFVFGVGAIGLLACALARQLGAAKVVAVDINEGRLDFALNQGFADQVWCLPQGERSKTSEEALKKAKEIMQTALSRFDEQDGFDVVFECTGVEPCIQMAVHAAITGGKLMLVGMGTPNVTFPLSAAALREVDIYGSFRYANTYPEAIALLSQPEFGARISTLVSHRFELSETKKAFELMARGRDAEGNMVLKVVVGPDRSSA